MFCTVWYGPGVHVATASRAKWLRSPTRRRGVREGAVQILAESYQRLGNRGLKTRSNHLNTPSYSFVVVVVAAGLFLFCFFFWGGVFWGGGFVVVVGFFCFVLFFVLIYKDLNYSPVICLNECLSLLFLKIACMLNRSLTATASNRKL